MPRHQVIVPGEQFRMHLPCNGVQIGFRRLANGLSLGPRILLRRHRRVRGLLL